MARMAFVLVATVAVVYLAAGPASVAAIKCYVCSSADPGCDTLRMNDTRYVQQCTEPDYFCRHVITSVLDDKNPIRRVKRSCAHMPQKDNGTNCYESDSDHKAESTCQCFADLCNAAPPRAAPLPQRLAVALAASAICWLAQRATSV